MNDLFIKADYSSRFSRLNRDSFVDSAVKVLVGAILMVVFYTVITSF